jgi:hypothetical protein
MSAQLEKLLNVARGEIGTVESPANSNTVKYNSWYYGRAVSGSNYAWCSVFVLWCFFTAELIDLTWATLNTAKLAVAEGAKSWKTLAQQMNRWVTSAYKPGDVVVFDLNSNPATIEHVGIVESVSADGKTLTTIEGNTSFDASGSQSNGGCVARKTRNIALVVGAYRPPYAADVVVQTEATPTPAPIPAPTPAPNAPTADASAPSSWATDAWDWATANGIADGTNPRGAITREQVATMLWRYMNLKL